MIDIPKILVVTNSISGGGAENSALMVYHELRNREIDIELIALNHANGRVASKDKRITILSRSWKDGFTSTFQNFVNFTRQMKRINPEIVIVHCELPELYIALVPKWRIRIIVVEHTTNPWDGRKTLGKIVRTLLKFRRVSWVTVTVGKNRIWFGSGRPTLIPNPVEATFEKSKLIFEEEYLYIGRLRSEKRPEWAIKAAVENNTPIAIIGDGDLAKELREVYFYRKDLVTFYGFVENPWSRIKKESLIIMPSEYEGDGLVAVEAIINGFAVVLSDNPDMRRLQLPDKNYFKTAEDLSHMISQSMQEGSQIFLPPDSVRQSFKASRNLESVAIDWLHLIQHVAKQG